MWSVLRNRNARLFVIGGAVMALGGDMTAVALPLFILHEAHTRPWLIGVVFLARETPSTVLVGFFGTYIDRIGARNAAVLGLILCTLSVGAMPFTVGNPVLIISCAFVLGTGFTLLFPIVSMYLPSLVTEDMLPHANSLFRTLSILGGIGGTSLAGALVAAGFYNWPFWFDALTSVAALGTILLIEPPHRHVESTEVEGEEGERSFSRSWLRSFQVVRGVLTRDRVLLRLFIADSLVYFSIGSIGVLLPVFASRQFHSAWLFSFAVLAENLGELLGGLAAPALNKRIPVSQLGKFYVIMVALMSVSYLLTGLWTQRLTLIALSFIASFALGVLYVLYGVYLQTAVSASVMGRFQTVAAGFSSVFQGTGNLVAGGMVTASARLGYVIIGGVNALVCIGILAADWRRHET